MNTIVITDEYDAEETLRDLYEFIGPCNLLKFKSYDDLRENIHNFIYDDYYIFNNVHIRYSDFENKKKLISNNNFSAVTSDKNIMHFKKKSINKITKDYICTLGYKFNYTSPNIFFKPKIDLPRIFLYSHNRFDYFKLTFNSLMHSLKHCREIPVTVILNNTSHVYITFCEEQLSKYPNLDVLLVDENAAFSAINIGLQWYSDLKYFIIHEDDFLLPPSVEYILPCWPYDFMARMKHFKSVGFGSSFINKPYQALHDWKELETSNIGWTYGKTLPLMAQCLMTNRDWYIKCLDKKAQASFDSALNSHSAVQPFFKGYHLGWNQGIDYPGFDKRPAFNLTKDKFRVINLRMNGFRIITLDLLC